MRQAHVPHNATRIRSIGFRLPEDLFFSALIEICNLLTDPKIQHDI